MTTSGRALSEIELKSANADESGTSRQAAAETSAETLPGWVERFDRLVLDEAGDGDGRGGDNPAADHSGAETPAMAGNRKETGQRSGGFVLPLTVAASGTLLIAAAAIALGTDLPVTVVGAMAFASALIAVGGVTLARLNRFTDSRRTLISDTDRLRRRIESLTDQAWELRESLELYRSVVDTVGDIVVRRNAGGNIVFVNDAFARTFGTLPQTVSGKPLVLRPIDEKILTYAGREERHVFLETVDGPRWFMWRDSTIRGFGEPALTQSIIRDVTESLNAEAALIEAREKAEAASRAKSRFVATVSHEIRTPLNGILGMASLLSDTTLTSEQINYVEAVKTSGEALLALVEDVLDFSKIEAGKLELSPDRTDLRGLVETLVELMAPRAHAKGIEIAGYIAPQVPETVMADGARLRQVLLNLAGNGVKFTETGGVSIEVIPTRREGETGGTRRLTFTVRDTGIGLHRNMIQRIFEEFEQAEPGPARRYGGTGLGLSISRRLVRLMGGEIAVDSAPGAGAAFSFTLDLPVADATEETPGSLSGRRVLLVSRSLVEIPLIARALSQRGADAEMVGDAECVSPPQTDEKPFDVVLIDSHSSCGPVATRETLIARGIEASFVVLVTPGERGDLDRYREEGFEAYLVKPVRGASLVRVITSASGEGGTDFEAGRLTVPRYVPKRKLTVLLAEDNDINALLARSALEKLGHGVRVVGDGRAAVNAFLAGIDGHDAPFDCILMDLHMPGLDGFQATTLIRDLEEERRLGRTPILALTADAMAESEIACRTAGADRRVTKPLDVFTLGAILDEAVGA